MPAEGSDNAAAVWKAMRRLVAENERTDEVRDALGLGHGSGRVRTLIALSEQSPLTLTEVAAELGVDAPYATLIVNQLETLGLVSRTTDPANRRRKLVSLTDAGTTATLQALAIVNRPPSGFERLTAEELQQLHALIERLAN